MTTSELKQLIESTIVKNNRKAIDANTLQGVLTKMVDSLGSTGPVSTFYTDNGTLTSNRTVDTAGYDLQFTNGRSFKWQSITAPSPSMGAFNFEGSGTTYLDIITQLKTGTGISYESYGNNTHKFYGQIGVNGLEPHAYYGINSRGYVGGASFSGDIYSVVGNGNGVYADFLSNGTNKNHAFYVPQIPNAAAFKVENPSGGSGGFKVAFQTSDWGANIGGYNTGFEVGMNSEAAINCGIRLNVQGAASNYAIDLINGNIKTLSGIGLTGTLNFESSTPGTVSSLTFDRGILIDKTLVP